jgi:hypothetical protein
VGAGAKYFFPDKTSTPLRMKANQSTALCSPPRRLLHVPVFGTAAQTQQQETKTKLTNPSTDEDE